MEIHNIDSPENHALSDIIKPLDNTDLLIERHRSTVLSPSGGKVANRWYAHSLYRMHGLSDVNSAMKWRCSPSIHQGLTLFALFSCCCDTFDVQATMPPPWLSANIQETKWMYISHACCPPQHKQLASQCWSYIAGFPDLWWWWSGTNRQWSWPNQQKDQTSSSNRYILVYCLTCCWIIHILLDQNISTSMQSRGWFLATRHTTITLGNTPAGGLDSFPHWSQIQGCWSDLLSCWAIGLKYWWPPWSLGWFIRKIWCIPVCAIWEPSGPVCYHRLIHSR